MIFGPTPLSEARGAVLAHTIRLDRRVLKKGTVLEAADIAALQEDGHASVTAARLEPGDVGENEAADRLAQALVGPLLLLWIRPGWRLVLMSVVVAFVGHQLISLIGYMIGAREQPA